MTLPLFLSILNWLTVLFPTVETPISNPQLMGVVPRLTTDANGRPLLSWVEKTNDKEAAFYFAVAPDGKTFGNKVRVKAPLTLSAHAEGMPKIAMKADGTLIAVFEVPSPTAESRFAGNLLYTMSTDKGQTWTEPVPVHRDASPGKSHSYSDITRLPNGEIGAVWLDEKLPGQEGRPVVFAQTTKGKGFGPALLVDDNACQCCRTSVFVDTKRNIHLTYRDLVPSGNAGEPASRDISTAVSTDGGRSFSKPAVVYADNWQVNACPHAGPMVAQLGNDIMLTWFSGKEGSAGLRLAELGTSKLASRVLSNRAKHPQIAPAGGRLIWVWDEAVSKDGTGEMGSFVQRIGMKIYAKGQPDTTAYLTPATVDATYPAILATNNGVLIAYEQTENKRNSVIVVRWLHEL